MHFSNLQQIAGKNTGEDEMLMTVRNINDTHDDLYESQNFELFTKSSGSPREMISVLEQTLSNNSKRANF
jgi:hypothetical protein